MAFENNLGWLLVPAVQVQKAKAWNRLAAENHALRLRRSGWACPIGVERTWWLDCLRRFFYLPEINVWPNDKEFPQRYGLVCGAHWESMGPNTNQAKFVWRTAGRRLRVYTKDENNEKRSPRSKKARMAPYPIDAKRV